MGVAARLPDPEATAAADQRILLDLAVQHLWQLCPWGSTLLLPTVLSLRLWLEAPEDSAPALRSAGLPEPGSFRSLFRNVVLVVQDRDGDWLLVVIRLTERHICVLADAAPHLPICENTRRMLGCVFGTECVVPITVEAPTTGNLLETMAALYLE